MDENQQIGSSNIPSIELENQEIGLSVTETFEDNEPDILGAENTKRNQYTQILLVHEFVHAVHDDKVDSINRSPWITEGIAEYITYDIIGFHHMNIKKNYKEERIPFDSFVWINGTIPYRYKYGISMVDYMVKTYGEGAIPMLVDEPVLSEAEIVHKITGMDMSALFDVWETFMVEDYEMIRHDGWSP